MLVVTFRAAGSQNCVVTEGTAYVYARTSTGSFVMPAACPHRGGPLHLADVTPDARQLICPWHRSRLSLSRLRRRIPSVRRGDTVTAVLPAASTAEVALGHRPVSRALSG